LWGMCMNPVIIGSPTKSSMKRVPRTVESFI
jgi:hypothetical protein